MSISSVESMLTEFNRSIETWYDYQDVKSYVMAKGQITLIEVEQEESAHTGYRTAIILPPIIAKLDELRPARIDRVLMKVESHHTHSLLIQEWVNIRSVFAECAQQEAPFLMMQKDDNSLSDRLRICLLIWTVEQ